MNVDWKSSDQGRQEYVPGYSESLGLDLRRRENLACCQKACSFVFLQTAFFALQSEWQQCEISSMTPEKIDLEDLRSRIEVHLKEGLTPAEIF